MKVKAYAVCVTTKRGRTQCWHDDQAEIFDNKNAAEIVAITRWQGYSAFVVPITINVGIEIKPASRKNK